MALRFYRCGTSTEILYAAPSLAVPHDDAVTPRLQTALHIARFPAASPPFRVIARLSDGTTALVCLATTREEARARARTTKEFPADANELRLQEWVGTATAGQWCDRGSVRNIAPRRWRRQHRRR
jgi:hypothetical protein